MNINTDEYPFLMIISFYLKYNFHPKKKYHLAQSKHNFAHASQRTCIQFHKQNRYKYGPKAADSPEKYMLIYASIACQFYTGIYIYIYIQIHIYRYIHTYR